MPTFLQGYPFSVVLQPTPPASHEMVLFLSGVEDLESTATSSFRISCVLLLESCCLCLPEILRAFFHWQNLYFDAVDRHLFTVVRSLVAENFRLIRVIFSPTLSVLFLKSHIILLSCSRDVENNGTSSANRRFAKQSGCRSPRLVPMPFSRQRVKSSSKAACRTVSNSKLLSGPPCLHIATSRG